MKLFPVTILVAACFISALRAGPLAGTPANWPEGAAPAAVGKRVAENFLPRKFRYETNPQKAHLGLIYPEAITWYGALTFAEATADRDLTGKLAAKFAPFLGKEGETHINRSAHVDYRLFGIVPLELYLATKDPVYRDLGISLADAQWKIETADGITAEARYWIDDMYMIPALQVQAFRATRDPVYLDRAALAMTAYLAKLQQANGLFHHGADSPYFWGRGNGWVAAGMAEILRELPADHPRRAEILTANRTMMDALLPLQTSGGMWRQLLKDADSKEESSATAMFVFALATGVKSGWLPAEEFAAAARSGWIALAERTAADGNVRDGCIGTDKGFSREFYLERPLVAGDLHTQAAVLWAATALLR